MRRLGALVALGIVVVMSGCAAIGSAPSLDGRQFLSVAVSQDGAPRPLVPGTRISLTFDESNLGAQAGCNHMGFSYRIDGGRLLTEGGAMTEMGCDEPRHAQDEWLAAFLGAGPMVTQAGDTLTLTDDGTVIVLHDREVVEPDLPLVGPAWVLEGIVSISGVSSVPVGVIATLIFSDDGQVRVETGCNTGGGSVEVGPKSMRFGPIALTKRACQGDAASVEQAVVAVLSAGEVAYAIEADLLTLGVPDLGLELRGTRPA